MSTSSIRDTYFIMGTRYDTLRNKYKEEFLDVNMSWENWFKQKIPDVRMRDYLRIESALMNSYDLFARLDSIEDDAIFKELIGSTHENADRLTMELNDADNALGKRIGKELINEYISRINK